MTGIDLTAGALIGDGRYRLERPLGSGGMAVVWLAADERLDRRVAVKVLSDVLAGDAAYIRRFEREARIAAQLSHPHLVRLFDYSANAQRPFLVMEYVAGPTLADLLAATDERGALDVDRLARELLGALAHIHAAGIVHRDVKPANVLIDQAGRAKLTDFGIARATDASRLTQTGNVIGTLRYLAPEVIDGQPATARSDLYACGTVLREAVRIRPSAAVAQLSERLAATEPDQRPQTAEEAVELLDRAPAATSLVASDAPSMYPTDPTAALPPSVSERTGRPTRELTVDARRALFLLAVLAVTLVALVVALSGGGDSADDPADSAPPTVAPSAPLEDQLRALERGVEDAAR